MEHPFRVIKQQFGYLKTRYRGLKKNTAQLMTLVWAGQHLAGAKGLAGGELKGRMPEAPVILMAGDLELVV
nr:transposase [Chromobacterium amazonense]